MADYDAYIDEEVQTLREEAEYHALHGDGGLVEEADEYPLAW